MLILIEFTEPSIKTFSFSFLLITTGVSSSSLLVLQKGNKMFTILIMGFTTSVLITTPQNSEIFMLKMKWMPKKFRHWNAMTEAHSVSLTMSRFSGLNLLLHNQFPIGCIGLLYISLFIDNALVNSIHENMKFTWLPLLVYCVAPLPERKNSPCTSPLWVCASQHLDMVSTSLPRKSRSVTFTINSLKLTQIVSYVVTNSEF